MSNRNPEEEFQRQACELEAAHVVTAADLSVEDRRRLDGGVEHILQKAAPNREDFLSQIRDLIRRYAVVAELSAVGG